MLCCGKYVTLPTFGTIKKSEIFRNLDSCLTFSDMYSTYFVLIIYHFVIIYHLDTLTSIYNLIYTSKQTVVASVCIWEVCMDPSKCQKQSVSGNISLLQMDFETEQDITSLSFILDR